MCIVCVFRNNKKKCIYFIPTFYLLMYSRLFFLLTTKILWWIYDEYFKRNIEFFVMDFYFTDSPYFQYKRFVILCNLDSWYRYFNLFSKCENRKALRSKHVCIYLKVFVLLYQLLTIKINIKPNISPLYLFILFSVQFFFHQNKNSKIIRIH